MILASYTFACCARPMGSLAMTRGNIGGATLVALIMSLRASVRTRGNQPCRAFRDVGLLRLSPHSDPSERHCEQPTVSNSPTRSIASKQAPTTAPIAVGGQCVTKRNMARQNTSRGRKALTFSRFCRYDSISNHRRDSDEKSFHDCATVRRVGICG